MSKSRGEYIRKMFIPFSVTIICVYALYLRILVLFDRTLGTDELYQLVQMKGTFFELLKGLPELEYCSYLSGDYYLIYPFFKIFSYNKFGLAIPHIIATIIGFYLLYLICKMYFKSAWAYIITFTIVCFNGTLINHATEIRTYAVLPTLALATFYLLKKMADVDFISNIAKKIGAIIFFVLVICFHAYGILIFSSCFFTVILFKYKEKSFKICVKNAVPLGAITICLAMPLLIVSFLGPHLRYDVPKIDAFQYIPNPIYNIIGFLKGIFCNLIGFKKLYFLLAGALVPFILHHNDRYKQLLFLSFIVIFPISVIFFSDIMHSYWFIQRQFIWVMPLFAFLLGWTWDSLFIKLNARWGRK